MVNVLILEKLLSEQILIQTYFPDYCIHLPFSLPAQTAEMLDSSKAAVFVIGPSAAKGGYPQILKLLKAGSMPELLIVFSRTTEAEAPARSAFGNLYGVTFLYSVMPADPGILRAAVDEFVLRKLRLISSVEDNYLSAKMSALVGESETITGLKSAILRLSTAPGPVLITGESGTGKEIAARLIHDFSYRREKHFHTLNAGAIPPGLSESELFGAEAGAYTGAVKRKGCFEQADGGTLFLDEIGELEKHIQVEFLRVLESGCIRRIGGSRLIKTNVRLVAATNRNLTEAVTAGRFRQDLLFRINVFQIRIPPLREHKEDIPDLLRHFSGLLKRERPDKYYVFSDSFVDGLLEHNWPGNVRELRNVFQRAVYASDSEVLTADSLQFDSFSLD